MSMTRDEIITLASRYLEENEAIDFPLKDDPFCILTRELSESKVLKEEEGWMFNGYGICMGYLPDEQVKPIGKWVFMHFASLNSFPPSQQVLRLQPPHIVKGRFQNPDRTREIRILKLTLGESPAAVDSEGEVSTEEKPITDKKPQHNPDVTHKIVKFRKKTTS